MATVQLDASVTNTPEGDNDPSRVSVFQRLTPSVSFADVVGKKSDVNAKLGYFPMKDRKLSSVQIPVELAREASKAYDTTVVGYFLGSRVPFPIVQRALQAVWGKHGFDDVMMNSNGFFFIKFNDSGGCTKAIEEGMVMIRNIPLFVSPWDPSKGLFRPSHDSCPLWVKLHNVPLVLFNNEGISRIASALGIPKQMDACTASMCDKRWGRPGFAKVLIDVWAVGNLKKELEVVIPHLHDDGSDKVKVVVEYLWEPVQCSHCCVFGHKISSCVKAMRFKENQKKRPENMDAEGFVRVERKQWKRKDSTDKGTFGEVGASTSGTKNDTNEVPLAESSVVELQGDVVALDHVVEPVTVVQQDVVSATTETVNKHDLVDVVGEVDAGLAMARNKDAVLEENIPLVTSHKDKNKGPVLEEVPPSVPPKPPRPPIKGMKRFQLNRMMEARSWVPINLVWMGSIVIISLAIMFNIASWNIRGLNNPGKQREVRDFMHTNCISIMAVLESHVWDDMLSSICDSTFRNWSWVSNRVYSPSGTRIIVAWNVRDVDVMPLEINEQFMHCQVKIRNSDDAFFVSFVYGVNREADRSALWSGLRKFKVIMGVKPWAILGDFNAMLFPHDALGGISRRNSAMASFFACVEDIEVFDANYSGIQFTWCQKPAEEGGLRRKLDRVLVNSEFVGSFPDSNARFFPRGVSDHSPAMLSFKSGLCLGGRPFKFDNFLVDHPLFLQTVSSVWSKVVEGTFMFRVTKKLKALKSPLRKLRGLYGNLPKRVADLKHELDVDQLACDMDPCNEDLIEDLTALRVAYLTASKDLEVSLLQRAKIKWMRDGDANTKFFHHAVRERRHLNQVQSIAKVDGTFVYDDLVLDAFVDHFKSFMGTVDDHVNPLVPIGSFMNQLSPSIALDMIRPITDEEIRLAMFGIGNDKAPGSDGFSSKFFKATWGIVGSDISVAIHNFFYRGHILKELNHTLLCMLPKKPNASSVVDFRPIACCTVLYKCISKIVVERIKPVLSSLVGNYQSAFIPGRRITDNILMAHELVVNYQRESGPPKCAFKIDIRKAYDMVNWRYLLNMLTGFGFHPVMVKWVEEMISTPTYSVSLNGTTRVFFQQQEEFVKVTRYLLIFSR
ncbi:hypothetical protein OSB04_un000113 [Centaurea solstitialis]|uniref:Reverse transcriptase domain-containing protein n=1 Tax=Centaurea solstitialis TaxID=347529 RepID=A0AA38S6J9_9ASTR|nr:hypothetical protein OSB04_un000113 [Centaurea solstitialis]